MKKLTHDEQRFTHMLAIVGGSYCPQEQLQESSAFVRLARRLERKGVITIEQVDTGYRYSLREGVNA